MQTMADQDGVSEVYHWTKNVEKKHGSCFIMGGYIYIYMCVYTVKICIYMYKDNPKKAHFLLFQELGNPPDHMTA